MTDADQNAPQNPIALATSAQAATPLDRMVELLNKGVTPENLEKLLAIQERWQAGEARRAYFAAMAAFRSEPLGAIVKRKNVRMRLKDKQTGQESGAEINYKHETLDQVVDVVREPLAKHGLSFAWSVTQTPQPQVITVACTMTHVDGHSEAVSLFGSPDDSGRKNPIQQVRSTVTFLQRATLLLLCGLAAKGEDDDGGGPVRERSEPKATNTDGKVTAAQVKILTAKLDKAGASFVDFCRAHKIEALTDLPFDSMNAALQWIEKQGAKS